MVRVARTRKSNCAILLIFVVALAGLALRVNWSRVQANTRGRILSELMASQNATQPNDTNWASNQAISSAPLASMAKHNHNPALAEPFQLRKKGPRFHLLIPATHSNPLLCKAVLSAFILGYPSPTYINWDKKFKNDDWGVKAHIAKIQGISDFLNDPKQVGDEDLVLIIDGFDIFFQLPPDLMIKRYEAMIAQHNRRLLQRYGYTDSNDTASGPRFDDSILFAADKICWPNEGTSSACTAVPESMLPADLYGPDTDVDTKSFHNRPRFMNSGAVIGPAHSLRDLYGAALERFQNDDSGAWSDQYILAAIWGEQEVVRQRSLTSSAKRAARRSTWWFTKSLEGVLRDTHAGMISNFTVEANSRHEYGIGIDYTNTLFQTMTHAADREVEFVTYSNHTLVKQLHKTRPHMLTKLPPGLVESKLPFAIHRNSSSTALNKNDVNYADYPSAPSIYPPNGKLDILPPLNTTWGDIPLASNLFASSIPCLLHLNGNFKPLMQEFWQRMWYHQHARALLRQYMRKSLGRESVLAASWGGQNWWDERGGRGGAWTDAGEWMDWAEMCSAPGKGNGGTDDNEKGTYGTDEDLDWEDEIFGDGLGVWGKELLSEPHIRKGNVANDWDALINDENAAELTMD